MDVILADKLPSSYKEIKNNCVSRFECFFGDAKAIVARLGDKLSKEQIMDIKTNGKTDEYYESPNIWGYFCVEPNTYLNYTFPIQESENNVNEYKRTREGIANFYSDKFDVYVIT